MAALCSVAICAEWTSPKSERSTTIVSCEASQLTVIFPFESRSSTGINRTSALSGCTRPEAMNRLVESGLLASDTSISAILHERPPLRDDLAHAFTLSRQLRQLLLVPLQCGRHNRRPGSLRVQEMPTEARHAIGSVQRVLQRLEQSLDLSCSMLAIGELCLFKRAFRALVLSPRNHDMSWCATGSTSQRGSSLRYEVRR